MVGGVIVNKSGTQSNKTVPGFFMPKFAVTNDVYYNVSMSFFSFGKRNKGSYSLVFNISSGSVAGGIINFSEKEGEDVTYYSKEIIPFQDEISVPKHLELLKSSLTTLAARIQAEGLKKIEASTGRKIRIDRVFYVFSSPWSVSQTKTIRIKDQKPIKITESYLSKLIKEQEKQFQAGISKVGKIIEQKIIQVKVNGYAVDNFYGKQAKDLELSVFFSVVPEDILLTIDSAVSKTFNVKNVWCHSLSLSTFSIIQDLFPQKKDFIHIDISEEMTDISIIKDNVMISAASIPLGRNDFIRELSKELKVTPEIADSMISMQTAKSNDQLAAMRLAMAMDSAARNWLSKIFEVLDSLKDKIYVPECIFLIANSDLIPFLKDKLEKRDFKVLIIENKKIKSSSDIADTVYKLGLMFLDKLYKI